MSIINFFSACNRSTQNETIKILKLRTPANIKGLDPAFANDLYSSNEVARVYEGLLQIHYLKRPYEIIPNLAESMPTVSSDELTYTFKLKKGVLFHDNACFPNGKGRELEASDVVYSLKRIADPKLESLGWWMFDGKFVGLNEWRDKNKKAEKVNYDEEVEGLKALDKYTVQFKLKVPYPQFLYALVMPFGYVVPHEAVEKYGPEFLNNPVGTGPFMTGKFTQSNKIVYEKNPHYRAEFYPSEGAPGDQENGLLEDAGKRIPLVDKVEVSIIVENQPAWLSFLKGEMDSSSIPKEYFSEVMNNEKLADKYSALGIKAQRSVGLDITYITFNMEDPLFKNNVKLRQALSSAYDGEKMNKLFYNGIAIEAQSLIPPDIAGNDPNYKNPYKQHDLVLAKKLLAEAGYPGGKGLPALDYYITTSTEGRQMSEAFRDMMKEIGVKINVYTVPWTELQKKVTTKQAQMFGMAWGADYPDAENFFKILYGPNKAPGANGSNFDDDKFNKLFEKASVMPDSASRTALYQEMYRYLGEQVPMIFGVHRVFYSLTHGWFKNYKFTEFSHGMAKYYNIDLAKKNELLAKLK